MKKAALIIASLFFFLFYVLVPSVKAQEFNFAKAYQDYIYTQTLYDQSYSGYEEAKNEYLKNPTLTLKEEARIKTLAMLRARDEYFRVYLAAVRIKLIETKVAVPTKLDDEIAWYLSHKDSYKDGDPLEDLFNKSKESESRHKSNTLPVTYETLFNISFGEIANIRAGQESVYKSLKNSIDIGVASGVLRLDPFNRWFTDIENVLKELDGISTKSQARIAKIYDPNSYDPRNTYSGAIAQLTQAIAKVRELNDFLTELLNSINAQLISP